MRHNLIIALLITVSLLILLPNTHKAESNEEEKLVWDWSIETITKNESIYKPVIAIDNNNNPHVIFSTNSGSTPDTRMKYAYKVKRNKMFIIC